MRRMIKEELLKFDGTPLFPERKAYTVNYKLSDIEPRSTRQSLNTCAMRWARRTSSTAHAKVASASRSPHCSAGSLPVPRRSFSR